MTVILDTYRITDQLSRECPKEMFGGNVWEEINGRGEMSWRNVRGNVQGKSPEELSGEKCPGKFQRECPGEMFRGKCPGKCPGEMSGYRRYITQAIKVK